MNDHRETEGTPIEVVHARLREELGDLSGDSGEAPVEAQRQLLVAMVPEIAARLGSTLAGREETDPRQAIAAVMAEEFYGSPELELQIVMAVYLDDYTASLDRWEAWTPLERWPLRTASGSSPGIGIRTRWSPPTTLVSSMTQRTGRSRARPSPAFMRRR